MPSAARGAYTFDRLGREAAQRMPDSTPSSFYVRDGDALFATVLTRGPWDDARQHGGPPAALLTGAIERADPDAGEFRLARVMVEYLRPIPLDVPLRITVTAVRAGRQAQRIDASLEAGGVEVARAKGLRLRTSKASGQASLSPAAAPLVPPAEESDAFPLSRRGAAPGYATAIDLRLIEGRWGSASVRAWGKPRVALVHGEPPSAFEGAMLLADAQSAMGPPLDPEEFAFVNPDLTAYFARPPVGPWTGLGVGSVAGDDGIGVCDCELFDGQGVFGRALQSLFIRRKPRGTMPPPPPSAGG